MTTRNKNILLGLSLALFLPLGGCREFVFGKIVIPDDENPLTTKKVPRTGAEVYFKDHPPVVTETIQNPDPDGAFNDWATCLVMIKEGHTHGGGKMHGNYVYSVAPWKQEEFAIVRNTASGLPLVDIDNKSTQTGLEAIRDIEGPEYFRVMGGTRQLWGLCLYFYDKEGNLINDKILKQSDRYQIFFTISEADSEGNPSEVLDCRWRGDEDTSGFDWKKGKEGWPPGSYPKSDPVPSPLFENMKTYEERAAFTPELFEYTYRDTWTHEDMNDGVRELFNLRLLPPLTKDSYKSTDSPYDVDCVGLKGHLKFDFIDIDHLDPHCEWPISPLTNGKDHLRCTHLLPLFHLSVRVMKCAEGTKAQRSSPSDYSLSRKVCDPYYAPGPQWKEIIRFNIPVKEYTIIYDSDPTAPDPYEPYYWHMAMELKLSPFEAYKAAHNVRIHSSDGSGGEGFGSWFL